ncbi:radical SAM family heme chaperone HemW [Ruegeria sp. HKCCD8929]|uniref:radical SAM family heme chaperone HemW n=1 Tax=Ruegeria sp. HKCCD8929 TaxID=2683006 RepID=UPI001489258E|nr:radical SAM family heme chaperone HemW [Ruegeria sp. HKCCD8929]
MADDWRNGGFGLYVHWPFCEAKCPYCDFNSHVSRNINQKQWVKAYLSELERSAAETPGRVLNTIFFGGGTPSLMEPDTVAAVIDATLTLWRPANDMEITLEANPGSVEAGRFAAYRDAGVNRVSMGIQALNDEDLRRLGRIHTVAEARAAFDIARSCFDRVSFDLIYARQHQTLDAWRGELTEALAMAIDHLSLYQLTIEDGTAFGDRYARGKLRGLPEDDNAADMYLATQEICEAHGMPAYEVSNHARQDAESRHNLIYWRYGDYVGIGPGAHGRVTIDGRKYATESHLAPGTWLQAAANGSGESFRTEVSSHEQASEYLMMCIRIAEGLDIARFEQLAGHPLHSDKLRYLTDLGMIEADQGRLKATTDGRAVLNAVIRELLTG